MTIAIIANSSSGLYAFRKNLIEKLIDLGHSVVAITVIDGAMDRLRALGVELVEIDFQRRRVNLSSDLSIIRKYKTEFMRIKPDLLISYTIKPNIFGGIVSRLLSIPFVPNITGMGSVFENNGFVRFAAIILYKLALKKAKVVLFENGSDRDCFVEMHIVSKKITHVLNGAGVDLLFFQYKPYPHNKVFKFLFMGRIMKEKGVDELLSAMKNLLNGGVSCHLDLLGSLEEEYSGILLEGEKEGWLEYHGYQTDVRPFIENCDCFVLPSYHEGMANTNLECASSGRPIITSNIPGCREAVIDGITGFLFEPKDARSLQNAMKKMIETPREEREKMGIIGRNHMEKFFDKGKVVEDTLKQLFC